MNRPTASLLVVAALSSPNVGGAQGFQTLFSQASAADSASRYADAALLYERTFAVSGGDPTVLAFAVESAAKAGDDKRALADLRRAISSGFLRADYLTFLARDSAFRGARQTREWQAAIDDARRRIAVVDTALRAELLRIAEKDQRNRVDIGAVITRYGRRSPQGDSATRAMTVADVPLLARVREIIAARGWPIRSLVGDDGAHAAWLVVQHAPPSVQRELLPLLRSAVRKNEARTGDLALLEDRVLVFQGKPQVYGSQTRYPDAGGPPILDLIEDELCVDQRRKEVGLEPLADYLRGLGVSYPGPRGRCRTSSRPGFQPTVSKPDS